MHNRYSAVGIVLLSLAAASCSGGTVTELGDRSSVEPPHSGDGGMLDAAPASPASLCGRDNGSLAFSATRIGGGPVERGAEVKSRNGFLYLLLTNECRVYCAGLDSVVHTATVTEAEASQLLEAFEIDHFAAREGTYYGASCDQPSDIYGLGTLQIEVHTACNGVEGRPPWLQTMQRSFGASVVPRCATYPAWDGDVRYVLVDTGPDSYPDRMFANAVRWPLSIAPDAVSVPIGGEIYNPTSARHLVHGAEASALRELRRRLLLGELAPSDVQFIPIEQPDKHRYLLYVSDSIPLEDQDGLLPFAR